MSEAKRTKHLNPYVLVILSFVFIILIGTTLLCMPWARIDNDWGWTSFLDQLFVSTSATCVTGLCTYADGIAGTLTIFVAPLVCPDSV